MQKFKLENVKQIKNDIDEIQRFALEHFQDNQVLFNIIDHLARVGGMFADIKEQELEGYIETADPEGYIKGKLDSAYSSMQHYLRLKTE